MTVRGYLVGRSVIESKVGRFRLLLENFSDRTPTGFDRSSRRSRRWSLSLDVQLVNRSKIEVLQLDKRVEDSDL